MVVQAFYFQASVVLLGDNTHWPDQFSDISYGPRSVEEKGPYTDAQQAPRKSYKKRWKHHQRDNRWEDNGIYFELTLSVCSFKPVAWGTTNTRDCLVANIPSFGLWVANPRDILALSEMGVR